MARRTAHRPVTELAALAAPDDPRLDRLRQLAPRLGAPVAVRDDPAVSLLTGELSPQEATAVRELGATGELDVVIRPETDPAARRLVVLDVDSTVIRNEVIDLLAAEAGCGDEVAAVTERAMAGELDFAASLTARVGLLAGLDAAAIDRARARMKLTPGVATMVESLHAAGHVVGVVSGGFTPFTDHLTARLGLDRSHANTLEVVDGRLTGRVLGEIVDADVKARTLTAWADAYGIDLPHTVAIGDGANDLAMIAAAGIGIAFCAKPIVRQRADACLSTPRLDVIPPLLGVTDRHKRDVFGPIRSR
ncbi:phosphoserine phosphatase SerB [Propionibacteriaceae bacterium Y1685]